MSASRTAHQLLVLIALGASASGCASTQLAAVWRDPAAAPAHFNKTFVAFVSPDETLRRTVEDKLAANFPGSVQSYKVTPSTSAADSAAIRRRLADVGFDGAIIMRVVDVQYTPTYGSGAYWYQTPYGFGNYWGSAWSYAYDPGYYGVNKIVSIETEVYALDSDKMIWAAVSETTNPQSAGKLTDSVIKHISKALRKDGLVLAELVRRLDRWSTAVGE